MSAQPRTDFWFAIAVTAFGGVVVVESWRTPRLTELGIDPLSAPGLTPGLLGLVLAALGVSLLIRSSRALAGGAQASEAESDRGWGRFSITLGLTLAFAVVLVGRVPFWLASALFLFAFILIFTWDGRERLKRIAIAVVLAGVVAVSVTLLFERVFLVRLP